MNEKRILKAAIAFVAVMITSFYIISMDKPLGECFGYSPKMFVVGFCPILWYCLAAWIGEKTWKKPLIVDFVTFNLISVGCIFVTQEILFKVSYFSADVIAEFYMYVTGVLAFVLHMVLKRKYFPDIRETAVMILIVALVAGVWLIYQERMVSIIESFAVDKNVKDIDGEYMNWISLRRAMFDVFIRGDFHLINRYRIVAMMEGCPFAVSIAGGCAYVIPVITAMYCIFSALLVLYAIKCKNALVTVVVAGFVMEIIIGLVSNVFLIFSSSVGLPFTRSVYDIISLAIILFSDREKQHS